MSLLPIMHKRCLTVTQARDATPGAFVCRLNFVETMPVTSKLAQAEFLEDIASIGLMTARCHPQHHDHKRLLLRASSDQG
jgi:hypothetical protein